MDTKQILTQAGNHVAEVLSKIDPAQVDALAKAIAKANRVFVSGWGRAGNVAGILGMDMSQIGKVVFRVGDNNTPSIHEGDILLVVSGSGNTKTISIIAKEAKDFGATVGLISTSEQSIIGEIADYNIVLPRIETPMTKIMKDKRPPRDPKFKSTAGTRETYDLTAEEREAITLDQMELTYQAAFILNEVLQQKVMEELGETFEAVHYYHNSLE
ncbi:MAG: SIS domain-containing protein [Christensenellaceae bacterium]